MGSVAPFGRYGCYVTYSWAFLAVAIVLVLTPGADLAVIVRNTVAGGRHVGIATTVGVSAAAALQGLLVAFGLAGFIVRAHPVFLAIKCAGIAYLVYLAATALLSAISGRYARAEEGQRPHSRLIVSGRDSCAMRPTQDLGVLPGPAPAVRRAGRTLVGVAHPCLDPAVTGQLLVPARRCQRRPRRAQPPQCPARPRHAHRHRTYQLLRETRQRNVVRLGSVSGPSIGTVAGPGVATVFLDVRCPRRDAQAGRQR